MNFTSPLRNLQLSFSFKIPAETFKRPEKSYIFLKVFCWFFYLGLANVITELTNKNSIKLYIQLTQTCAGIYHFCGNLLTGFSALCKIIGMRSFSCIKFSEFYVKHIHCILQNWIVLNICDMCVEYNSIRLLFSLLNQILVSLVWNETNINVKILIRTIH